MKYLYLILLSLLIALALSIASTLLLSRIAKADDLEGDKRKHFIVSAIISSGVRASCEEFQCKHPALTAFGVSLSVGLAKELTDEKFDRRDLLYDVLGAGFPLILWEF